MKLFRIGFIGLGKMGLNMVERLLERGYEVVVFDKNKDAVKHISSKGAGSVSSLQSIPSMLSSPGIVWLMLPHQVVDSVINSLETVLQKGDIIIDGGNSPYKESMRRAKALAEKGIEFLDVGISGGPSGARTGASIMVGGNKGTFIKVKKLFKDLSFKGGYGYVGKSGAGHFVKMVHNGIEYGMMQALAEGFTLMKASPFKLSLSEVADIYNHRSVIESRLVGWLINAFNQYGEELNDISGNVTHSGEGKWTVETAKEFGIPVPIIEQALQFRIQSQDNPSYTGQILSALRSQFGGHEVLKNIMR